MLNRVEMWIRSNDSEPEEEDRQSQIEDKNKMVYIICHSTLFIFSMKASNSLRIWETLYLMVIAPNLDVLATLNPPSLFFLKSIM